MNIFKRRQAQLGSGGTALGGDTIAGGMIGPDTVQRMPDPGDPALVEGSRMRMERARRSGGRMSTILSDNLRNQLRGIGS